MITTDVAIDAIKAKEATESLKSMDIAELVESVIQK